MRLSRTLSFLGVIALAAPVYAQDWKGNGRLEGKVMDTDGKPIPDAVVRLELPGRGGTQLKADKKGKWAFLGLASGSWNVDFEADGFATKRLSVPVSQESRTPPMEVKLDKAAGKQAAIPPEVMEAVKAGDTAYAAGKWAEARGEYEKLLALRPDLAGHLHQQIARCYHEEKNYAKAVEHLQAMLTLDPTNEKIRTLAALEALEGGLFDRGIELLQGLDEANLQDPDIMYNIGVAFFNKGKPAEAAQYLTKAITLNPAHADAYYLRGNAHLGLNKVVEAKADYKKFLELAPTDARAEIVKKALTQLK
jgi:tetratricopeptide (TPR) repeat protein